MSRPDEPSWTCHQSYIGLEPPPPWATTTCLVDRMGEVRASRTLCATSSATRIYGRQRSTPRPGGLSGGTRRLAIVPSPRRTLEAPADVERGICEITAASSNALREPARGLAANPARRFVVWPPRRSTSQTYSEIGQRLRLSPNQAAQEFARPRTNSLALIAAWQDACWARTIGR